MFLQLNGIPSEAAPTDRLYFRFDPQGVWRPSSEDRSNDVEAACVRLHDAFAHAIFPDWEAYRALLPALPQFVPIAGMNSEAPISKQVFEQFLESAKVFPEINRFLYLYDCQRLVAGIQECTKEILQILGEFYRTLNLEEFFFPKMAQPDGVRYTTSPVTTKLSAYLGFIFIRLHSLLDYTVKLALEAEGLQTRFESYPRMRSLSSQYGDRKRIRFNGTAGTLFENCAALTFVETLRNHLIHDGLLDDMPKAYEVIENGAAIERFLLWPDMVEGRFERLKNRNLFYGAEHKINQTLPGIIFEFQARQVATLSRILTTITSTAKA